MKKLVALRGAVCCENTPEDITENVCNMCNAIVTENKIKCEDLVSIHFTVTKEINVLNPATALRKGKTVMDFTKTALFCSQEAEIQNAMKNVVRVMITAYSKAKEKTNVYLNGAEKLRPDYSKKSN